MKDNYKRSLRFGLREGEMTLEGDMLFVCFTQTLCNEMTMLCFATWDTSTTHSVKVG